jgi:hypothetical protein
LRWSQYWALQRSLSGGDWQSSSQGYQTSGGWAEMLTPFVLTRSGGGAKLVRQETARLHALVRVHSLPPTALMPLAPHTSAQTLPFASRLRLRQHAGPLQCITWTVHMRQDTSFRTAGFTSNLPRVDPGPSLPMNSGPSPDHNTDKAGDHATPDCYQIRTPRIPKTSKEADCRMFTENRATY